MTTTQQQHSDELKGVLFKNDNKTHDRQPSHKGEIQVAGRKYWLSAWIREAKSGRKYFSLALTPDEDIPIDTKDLPDADDDDDIAF